MSSPSISEDNPQNNINKSNISTYGNNQIRNYSDNEMPPIKIPNNILTRSLKTKKVISIGLFALGAVAAAVSIAAAVASLAFAVAFLPLITIVGIGITSVALLTTGIILRLKKDTLSEENLPDIIKLLAKSDKNYIKDNIDFVKKVIEFHGENEVLGKLIDEECGTSIESLIETLKNSNIDNAKGLTEKLELIKKNCELIKSISSLKEGENVYKTLQGEANFKDKILSPQENNDTEALDETVSFFENQKNKNKLIELAKNHTCGIMKYDAVIDNNGTISKFEKGPNEAFLSPKKGNNVDKKSKDTENYDVILNKIHEQSESDFDQPVTLIIENKEIKTKNLDDLKNKIKEKSSKDAEKIIKKILSFPCQSSFDISTILSAASNENIKNKAMNMNIQYKIEIKGDNVYLYTSNKYKVTKNDIETGEVETLPICIEESKKYRLNGQEENKYTVPTLLAEHIAVFEAKPYVTEEGNLVYLKIGEKKSEFNWINPKPEELVILDVEKDAVNDKK